MFFGFVFFFRFFFFFSFFFCFFFLSVLFVFSVSRMIPNILISRMKFCYYGFSLLKAYRKSIYVSRNILKDLDPSNKPDIEPINCFGKEDSPSYNQRNTVIFENKIHNGKYRTIGKCCQSLAIIDKHRILQFGVKQNCQRPNKLFVAVVELDWRD